MNRTLNSCFKTLCADSHQLDLFKNFFLRFFLSHFVFLQSYSNVNLLVVSLSQRRANFTGWTPTFHVRLSFMSEENKTRKTEYKTSFQQDLKNEYRPDDLTEWNYDTKLGNPGEFPFTRGVQKTMYRSRFWTMRQYAGFGSAENTNRRFHYLLSQGQTGLSVAFDLPTQMGYDSDHDLSRGEVGRVGVAIDSLEDMERLLDGIPLDQVSTSMTINATAFILLGLYVCVAKKRGIPLDQISGTVQNDILKEYIARGTYIYPPDFSLKLVTDVMAYCGQNVPRWNTISISGYHVREAGSNSIQEVAFTLADGVEYVKAARAAGLRVDDFAPRLSFFFAAHNNVLEEAAKFRAARRIWAGIMKNHFGAQNEKSWQLRFHTQTAGSTLTAQQPMVNISRVTLQALAAVLGGTQSLHTNAWDEALALPTEASALLALRTQQLIAHESGAADVADPLAGSYYIERITDDIERGAVDYMQRIEAMGGMLKAIETGFVQREIQDAAYRYARALEEKKELVVGVNVFRTREEPIREILTIDPRTEADQIERLNRLRAQRDSARVAAALSEIEQAVARRENIMEPLIEALLANATLGEVSDLLRRQFGEYRETSVL